MEDRHIAGPGGERFVSEACDLSGVPDGTYDFVLASHVLEHTANPLRALQEWKRVIRPGGALLVVVPHKERTFDHKRPFTSFEHVLADYEAGVDERDLTHLDEVLSLHDLALDPAAGAPADFRERCNHNYSVRAMHHHVISPQVLVSMLDFVQMLVLHLAVERPFHIVGFARKESPQDPPVYPHNLSFPGKSSQ